jgi:hypothetical protein
MIFSTKETAPEVAVLFSLKQGLLFDKRLFALASNGW